MNHNRKGSRGEAARACLKYIAIFLPVALVGAGVNTYLATRVALTAEDSLKMTQEAEDNVSQLETVLDGTPQSWQKLMLTAKKIYELGGLATPALLRLASSKKADPMIRKMAIEIVRDLGDERAIVPFTRIARDTANPDGVRDDALYSLGHIGTEEVIDTLLVFLRSHELLLKEGALAGIRVLPCDVNIDRAFQPTAKLAMESKDTGLRHKAILALSAFGDKAVPLLSELLKSKDAEIRHKAICGLSGSGCRSAVPPLAQLLSSDDQSIRTSAIFALENLRDPAAVPALIEVLERGGYDASNAARALGYMGDRRALEALGRAIESAKAEGKEPGYHFVNSYEKLKKQHPEE